MGVTGTNLFVLALAATCVADTVHHHHNYYGDVHNEHGAKSRSHDDHDVPHVEHHKAAGYHDDHGDRSYMFQLSGAFGAYEYLDANGVIKGFNPDFVKKVCEKAGKKCYWMFDTVTHCWRTSGGTHLPGPGLMDGWYDGCVGLYSNQIRLNTFNFTEPFTRPIQSVLRFRGGRGPTTNLQGLRIGFGDGWTLSPECLAKQTNFRGNQPGDFEPRFYSDTTAMVRALKLGEVHAILVDHDLEDHSEEEQKQFSEPFSCVEEGSAVMVRYGSDVTKWWNKAVDDMKHSGEYDEFCTHAQALHRNHGHVHCLDTGHA